MLRGNPVLHHKCSTCRSLNNFLLTVFPDRCMLSPSNPALGALSGILEGFIRRDPQWVEPSVVPERFQPSPGFSTRSRNAYDRQG